MENNMGYIRQQPNHSYNTYNSMNIQNTLQPSVQNMYNSDNHVYTYGNSPKYVNNKLHKIKNIDNQPSEYDKSRVIFKMTNNYQEKNNTSSRIDYLHNRSTQNRYNQQFNNNPSSGTNNYQMQSNSINPYNRQQFSEHRNRTTAKITHNPQNNINKNLDMGWMQFANVNRVPQQNRTNYMPIQMYERNTRQNEYLGDRGIYKNQYKTRD